MQQRRFFTIMTGIFTGLVLLGFVALAVFATYKHYAIPYGHGRGHDVWGNMMVVGIVGISITGGYFWQIFEHLSKLEAGVPITHEVIDPDD